LNTHAIKRLRSKLARDEAVFGLWVTLESASITEMAVAMDLDWVVIDAEHGHLDWHNIVEHLRGAVRSNTVVLVRITELNAALVKRVLDIGADGVVVPWIETRQQLTEAVRCIHYPPRGIRGIGAERATCWGRCFQQHVDEAEENLLLVPIIESVRAGKSIRELTSVDGVELFFFGPADYSASAGHPGQWEGPGVAEQILAAKDAIRQAGKHCGVIATNNDNLQLRIEQGFRMLGLGLDGGLLIKAIESMLPHTERDRTIAPGFVLESEQQTDPAAAKRCQAPENLRPDRPPVMTNQGSGVKMPMDHGVVFECHVGRHNQARNLTTGIVNINPNAMLAYHRHTFTESITVLSGQVVIEVEGRRYRMAPMDNIVILPGLAHQTHNSCGQTMAKIHISMGTDQPQRELVDHFYSKRAMPDDSIGQPGQERVNRFASAPRYEAGPNTQFVDFFNETLTPGVEMSGGHGLFYQGGRLPAHLHDFDESICIIDGQAVCVVEGQRHQLSDCATALQPRGRVHYFINEAQQTMQMLWVYAGPRPERMELDDQCCTREASPWR
jgi:2-keto-3-deoxy-L-rhamnonate aldolase RhmA/quercetin dioxygenase-like cupin family protein